MTAANGVVFPDSSPTAKKYDKIADDIRKKVLGGVYTQRIPGERELAQAYGVHVLTANKAVTSLVDEGLLYRMKGVGTFVTRLKRARTGNLAAVVGDVQAPLHARIVRGMDAAASAHGQHLLFRNHFDDPRREADFIDQLLDEHKADGFLLWPTTLRLDSPGLRRLAASDVPFVVFPHLDPAVEGRVSAVISEDRAAARMATRHLIELGHERIAFVISQHVDERDPVVDNRLDGYREAMGQAGLPPRPPLSVRNEANWDDLAANVRRRELTGLFCIADDVAIAVLRALRERGVRVPGDVSVVGLDGVPRAADFGLTTVEQPMEAVGAKAVELLLDEIEERCAERVHIIVRPRLILRDTTGRPVR